MADLLHGQTIAVIRGRKIEERVKNGQEKEAGQTKSDGAIMNKGGRK